MLVVLLDRGAAIAEVCIAEISCSDAVPWSIVDIALRVHLAES